MRESFHFPIKAHKPLYEWKGTGERPDFVVTATSHGRAFHLVIETMGFDTHSYRARKVEMRSKLGDSVDWHEDNRAFRPQLVKGAVSTALYNWLTMVAD